MPKLTNTQLETLSYSSQGWNKILSDNMEKLNDTLLKVSEVLDVDFTSLADGDIFQWDAASSKWKNVQWTSVIPTTTTTSTTTITTTSSSSTASSTSSTASSSTTMSSTSSTSSTASTTSSTSSTMTTSSTFSTSTTSSSTTTTTA